MLAGILEEDNENKTAVGHTRTSNAITHSTTYKEARSLSLERAEGRPA